MYFIDKSFLILYKNIELWLACILLTILLLFNVLVQFNLHFLLFGTLLVVFGFGFVTHQHFTNSFWLYFAKLRRLFRKVFKKSVDINLNLPAVVLTAVVLWLLLAAATAIVIITLNTDG